VAANNTQSPRPLPQMSLSTSIPSPSASAPVSKIEKPQAVRISPKPQAKAQSKESPVAGHIPLYPQFRTVPLSQQSPSQTQSSSEQRPPQPVANVTVSPATQEQKPLPKGQEPKQKLSDLEKGFLAEFEQSAELLLRPYIASWLEEHFHHLFEKILREEIQRLMQKNLRR